MKIYQVYEYGGEYFNTKIFLHEDDAKKYCEGINAKLEAQYQAEIDACESNEDYYLIDMPVLSYYDEAEVIESL